jgi:hypothetical protein
MYSFPFAHSRSLHQKDHPSRPDPHALVIIFLPLLQLTVIHLLGIRQDWAHQRLIPTTIIGLLGLAHFHYAIFYSPLPYPFANYLTSIIESILLITTVMTVTLNTITQLLLEGAVTRPLIGLGTMADTNLFGIHPSAMPSREDDFSLAILRLGTASFEATGVAGLQNEVSSVLRPVVTLDKIGADTTRLVSNHIGFNNEITTVQAVSPIQDTGLSTDSRLRAGKEYLFALGRMLRNLWPHTFKTLKRMFLNWRSGTQTQPQIESRSMDAALTEAKDLYQTFLRGDNISDDEDDPFIPGRDHQSTAPSSEVEEEDSQDEGDYPQPQPVTEPMNLYTDLKISSRPSTPILVAHLVTSGQSPLTRRRYNTMRRPSSSDTSSRDDWSIFTAERRREALARRIEQTHDVGNACVICTVEPRDIICWPCR